MAKYIKSHWTPQFWSGQPYFSPISLFADVLAVYNHHWPTLDDYQSIIDNHLQNINTKSGFNLKIVPQDGKPSQFNEHYAPRIYLTGEIQTRTENWHDFFQVLSWVLFPRTKAVINERHYYAARNRYKNNDNMKGARSKKENFFSLFDECGGIVLSTDGELLNMIRLHEWVDLFWLQRENVDKHLECVIFGHAMNEKLIKPYVGMTANCLMFEVDVEVLKLPLREKIKHIDTLLSQHLQDDDVVSSPKDLSPLPVLGLPGWYGENENEDFYNNKDYFR